MPSASNSPTQVSRRSRSRSPIRRRSRSPQRNGRGKGRDVRGKECRVYVSNLNYDVKWMVLKDVMKKEGNVEHVEIFTDNAGRSKGSGIVEYSNAEDAARAIKKLDGSDVAGRKIRLREDQMNDDEYTEQLRTMKEKSKLQKEQAMRGPPMNSGPPRMGQGQAYGGRGASSLGGGGMGGVGSLLGGGHAQLIQLLNSKGGDPINSSVFISNLDYETSWQEVKDMFRRAGNCTRCEIAQDDDRRSKGFGSVQFETPFEALTAIAMFNGVEMGARNRRLSVRLDRAAALHQVLEQLGVPSNEVTEKTIQQLQSIATLATLTGTGGLGALGGLGGALGQLTALASASSNPYQSSATSSTTQALSSLTGLSGLGGALGSLQTLLAAGGLGSTLNSLAGATGGSAQSAASYGGASSVGAGYGSQSNGGGYGSSLGGGYGSQSSRRDSVGGGYSSSRSGDGGGGRGVGGRGGGGRDAPCAPGCRVFVRNLPFSLKWQDLKDRFRDAGHITRADIKTNEDGRSKGCGTITFENTQDASRAVSLFNGTRIDGREVEVKIDQMA